MWKIKWGGGGGEVLESVEEEEEKGQQVENVKELSIYLLTCCRFTPGQPARLTQGKIEKKEDDINNSSSSNHNNTSSVECSDSASASCVCYP